MRPRQPEVKCRLHVSASMLCDLRTPVRVLCGSGRHALAPNICEQLSIIVVQGMHLVVCRWITLADMEQVCWKVPRLICTTEHALFIDKLPSTSKISAMLAHLGHARSAGIRTPRCLPRRKTSSCDDLVRGDEEDHSPCGSTGMESNMPT
jgi:hypothetical protein